METAISSKRNFGFRSEISIVITFLNYNSRKAGILYDGD